MSTYLIEGGHRLGGEVGVHGAKNSVLPILAATILCRGECELHNVPQLSDVAASVAILEHLGCRVSRWDDVLSVDARDLTRYDVPDHLMREMRSSVIFLGAILARMGAAQLSFPGGCELGPRPIDLHLAAMRQLGARIDEEGGGLDCTVGDGLVGCQIDLAFPSVGATENAMLCAYGAQGTTTITNAAREPEIADLQGFLQAMGGRVTGAGTSTITVEGGRGLHSGAYTVMPDRIVAATLLSATAAAGGTVTLLGVDHRTLSTVTALFDQAGCQVDRGSDYITITRDGPLKGVRPIRTAPYPGFPTDAQSPVMAALTLAQGSTMFVENIFGSRYRHVDELIRMGADIRVEGKVAVVCGVKGLHGARVRASDLRGGAALVVAALAATGTSEITGLAHIDRGYDRIEDTLTRLGANIRRIPGNFEKL